MIEQEAILHWSEEQPWQTSAMVEQDLVICRALVDIFSDEFLSSQLAYQHVYDTFIDHMPGRRD